MEVRPAALAWGTLITGVIVYDALCPHGETLSEGVDRALDHHRCLTIGSIAVTAAHLTNLLPERYDPFAWVVDRAKRSLAS